MIEIEETKESPVENSVEDKATKSTKQKKKLSNLTSTFFRNALRSNLDLTALADTKAGILISINGFILTVSVTASSFMSHNSLMTYAFVAIILTSLGSIIFAVMAVKPRAKDKLVKREFIDGYNSLLFYQDMADQSPEEYTKSMNKVLKNTKKSKEEMITHLHILGAEIKKKYFWLKQAYTFFSLGLIISASLIIYALLDVEEASIYNQSTGSVIYKEGKFYNIFEPSGATTMPDGKVLIVEDESGENALKLIEVDNDGDIVEIGNLYLPKAIKKRFKKDIEDIEALASKKNIVYAITSHSLSRSGKAQKKREQLIRFKYEDGSIENFDTYGELKKDLYKEFSSFFKAGVFSADEINIEGLCYDKVGKRLLLGFRSPVKDGKAIIIAIENPDEVFLEKKRPQFSKPIFINLYGLGIRDITYDSFKDGYWIIAGSVSNRDSQFQLWYLDRKSLELSFVKEHPDMGYGEGITIINQESNVPSLLIVQDNGLKPNKAADYLLIDRDSL